MSDRGKRPVAGGSPRRTPGTRGEQQGSALITEARINTTSFLGPADGILLLFKCFMYGRRTSAESGWETFYALEMMCISASCRI